MLTLPRSNRRRSSLTALRITDLFESAGWQIELPVHPEPPDLVFSRDGQRFVAEAKAIAEARVDRVLPLLSQATLQAQAYARDLNNAEPLPIICVQEASPSLMNNITAFMQRYAPGVSFGVIDDDGFRHFEGPGLAELNATGQSQVRHLLAPPKKAVNLFSDLNQWMLKVLVSPELPHKFLSGPKRVFRTNFEFANAAGVSTMTASRFLQQLRAERYLLEGSKEFVLVRREELFRRWRAMATRTSNEVPARFAIKASVQRQLGALVDEADGDACLGLYAAADALEVGHVSGVPPHVYVAKMPPFGKAKWRAIVPASDAGPRDLIIREAQFPQSTFRGAVRRDGMLVTDIIQVWLDVSGHPARGDEQANLIYEQHLLPLIRKQS